MKYIDADKLIAEIERRIKENEILPHRYIRLDEDKQLLSFITSLPQERPEVDLEEEMTAYIERHFHIRYDETLEVGNDPLTTHDFEEIARHFYELGRNARKEE